MKPTNSLLRAPAHTLLASVNLMDLKHLLVNVCFTVKCLETNIHVSEQLISLSPLLRPQGVASVTHIKVKKCCTVIPKWCDKTRRLMLKFTLE